MSTFDPTTRTGTVIDDSGELHAFDAAAFDAGSLRLLRSGQRVQADTTDDGRVVRIDLATLG